MSADDDTVQSLLLVYLDIKVLVMIDSSGQDAEFDGSFLSSRILINNFTFALSAMTRVFLLSFLHRHIYIYIYLHARGHSLAHRYHATSF